MAIIGPQDLLRDTKHSLRKEKLADRSLCLPDGWKPLKNHGAVIEWFIGRAVMERRSERLAILQKLKPISYRETGVKRVFKRIRRKRHSLVLPAKREQKMWQEAWSQRSWGTKSCRSEDLSQPCCSKDLLDQSSFMIQHCFETPPLVEPIANLTMCQVQQPLILEEHSRPFMKILACIMLIFVLGIFLGFTSGLCTPSDNFKHIMKVQLSKLAKLEVKEKWMRLLRAADSTWKEYFNSDLFLLGTEKTEEVETGFFSLMEEALNFLPKKCVRKLEEIESSARNSPERGPSAASPETNWVFSSKSRRTPDSCRCPWKYPWTLGGPEGAYVVKFSNSFNMGAQVCMLGFCWDYVRSPDVILERDNIPGNCWAMEGSQGYVVIKLSQAVCPTTVALDHISKTISHTEEITSAPKNFSVYGFKNDFEKEEGHFLGSFVYRVNGFPLQTFKLEGATLDKFNYLLLKILTNWNHPNYTCIYGFRVYGE